MEYPVLLQDISVRYNLPKEKIRTLKEFMINALKKRIEFEEFWALRNVTLEIPRGQVLGIIGRNGAGKSTLLKVVAGIIKPRAGRVAVKGRVAPLIELGGGFDLELTGQENIYFFGSIYGVSRKYLQARYEGIVEFSELQEFIEAPMRTYSQGMVTRLAFSVATSIEPDILLLDEVLSVGDLDFQQKCLKRIDEFRRQGVTIIFVSHNLEQVRSFCDTVMWLHRGQVAAQGPTEEVVSQYINHQKLPAPGPLLKRQQLS
jgi:ABC-type polysaccharide/polyol phosphate transport system ATPase subunit